MTIYTTAATVAKHDVCPGGTDRTAEALAKRGMTMDSRVTIQIILNDMGLCDALFSFCEVEKASRKEAEGVIREYMLSVAGYALRFLSLDADDNRKQVLLDANKAINKRCEGISRPALSRRSFVEVNRLYNQETDTKTRHWLNAYKIMLAPKPDHVTAVHATIALLEGCEVLSMDNEMRGALVHRLADLLGPCPMMGND